MRTDSPLADMATGAWLWTVGLCLFGYYYLTIVEGRAWTRS